MVILFSSNHQKYTLSLILIILPLHYKLQFDVALIIIESLMLGEKITNIWQSN